MQRQDCIGTMLELLLSRIRAWCSHRGCTAGNLTRAVHNDPSAGARVSRGHISVVQLAQPFEQGSARRFIKDIL